VTCKKKGGVLQICELNRNTINKVGAENVHITYSYLKAFKSYEMLII
jgi:hypothetical protein